MVRIDPKSHQQQAQHIKQQPAVGSVPECKAACGQNKASLPRRRPPQLLSGTAAARHARIVRSAAAYLLAGERGGGAALESVERRAEARVAGRATELCVRGDARHTKGENATSCVRDAVRVFMATPAGQR